MPMLSSISLTCLSHPYVLFSCSSDESSSTATAQVCTLHSPRIQGILESAQEMSWYGLLSDLWIVALGCNFEDCREVWLITAIGLYTTFSTYHLQSESTSVAIFQGESCQVCVCVTKLVDVVFNKSLGFQDCLVILQWSGVVNAHQHALNEKLH